MLESLNSFDKELFIFLNHQHSAVFDFLMYWASNRWIWIPFYALLAFYVYREFPKRFILILVFIAAVIALSDQAASGLLKTWVMRLRPCHDPSIAADVHLVNGYCGGQYGFVSSHASNAFALFSFLFFLVRKKNRLISPIALVWAIVVSYSRIYLGAHFPGDVICGALLGIGIGYLCWKTYILISETVYRKEKI